MKRLLFAAAFASTIVLSGCATVTATSDGQPKLATEADVTNTHDFFAWGLVPEKQTVNVQGACPGGVRQLQTQTTGIQAFLSYITIGIYMPRTSRIWCE